MTAYLTLKAGADLTISDIEAWIERARTLGADDSTPVQLGAPPSPVPAGSSGSPDTAGLSEPSGELDTDPARGTYASPAPGGPSGRPDTSDTEAEVPALTVQVTVRRTVLPPTSTRARVEATP
ncbi:MAG: hypothetical protein ACRDN9_21640 [Streptosporangiaceae bacterium]